MRLRLLLSGWALAQVVATAAALGAPGDLLRVFRNPNPPPVTPYGFPFEFGVSMAVSGNNVLIGAPYAPAASGWRSEGAAYLFDGSTGELLRTFRNPDPRAANQTFGQSVATLGDNFLIGGPDCGVHLFDGATGELLRSFQDPMPTGDDQFGASIAALGGNVLVGDPGDSALGSMAGAVYLLDGSTGGLLRTFSSPDPTEHVRFGHSLAAVGANVLVGSPDGDPTDSGGVAYLLDAGTGAPLLTLNDPHGTWHYDGSYFGLTVAAHGGDVLVGGESHSVSAGVVRFDGRTGAQLTRYMYPGFDPSDGFGYAIARAGDRVLVGAMHAVDGRGGYLFDATTGDLLLTLRDPGIGDQGRFGTYFGYSVAGFGRDLLISAPGDDSDGKDFGRVYLFEGVPEPATSALLAVGVLGALVALLCRRNARRMRGRGAESRVPGP